MAENSLPLADELAGLAARMSPMLLTTESVSAAVEVLTWLAQETVGAATGAGVSLIDDHGRRTSKGATSALVLAADDWQYQLNEGPCLTSWAERRTVKVDDVGADPRWPRWSESVRPLGLRSSVSAPMEVGGRALGAVKVYSEQPSAFDERAERLLEGFAGTAALLLGNVVSADNERGLSEQLRQALKARDRVQLAAGVLMERDGLTQDQSFQALVAEARTSSRELATVAARVIDSAASSS